MGLLNGLHSTILFARQRILWNLVTSTKDLALHRIGSIFQYVGDGLLHPSSSDASKVLIVLVYSFILSKE